MNLNKLANEIALAADAYFDESYMLWHTPVEGLTGSESLDQLVVDKTYTTKQVRMYESDWWALHGIAECVRSGLVNEAERRANWLDTVVREVIPAAFWKCHKCGCEALVEDEKGVQCAECGDWREVFTS